MNCPSCCRKIVAFAKANTPPEALRSPIGIYVVGRGRNSALPEISDTGLDEVRLRLKALSSEFHGKGRREAGNFLWELAKSLEDG